MRVLLLAICVGSFAFPSSAVAEDDLAYCTVCHGAHGNGNYSIRAPKIAGMEPWYLRRQLESFRSGRRGQHSDDAPGHEMRPVGIRLKSDAEITRAIDYVATFEPKQPPATIAGNVENGRMLYASCSACHGTHGEGNEALGAPALASRSDWYLLTQLVNFSLGIRGGDPADVYGVQMRAAAATLQNDEQRMDVVAYINTLR